MALFFCLKNVFKVDVELQLTVHFGLAEQLFINHLRNFELAFAGKLLFVLVKQVPFRGLFHVTLKLFFLGAETVQKYLVAMHMHKLPTGIHAPKAGEIEDSCIGAAPEVHSLHSNPV
jgi:hypothetical protein